MIRKIKNFFQRNTKLFSINVAILLSFIFMQMQTWIFPTIAFAKDSDGGDVQFNLQAPKQTDAFTAFSDVLQKIVGPFQGVAATVMVISCIAIGIRLGYAAGVGDARGRQDAITSLFWLIVAGVIVVNARSIVGIAAGGSTGS